MNVSSPIARLRIIAILEGISYLLLGITMPLKYFYQLPEPNFYVGLAHGVLFMLYIVLCLQCALLYKWPWHITFWAFIASVIPFGTFVADARIFKKQTYSVRIS
ncbi:DUF3817 domain-containing protein [Ascidiimonas aurantiaca]|uniref:DUF3817 domain-containing protein n=1 Tax=Ascidiimonas aurantiaca TaxID=1685432 RepID=UPI0030EC04D7